MPILAWLGTFRNPSLTEEQSRQLDAAKKVEVADEMADVLLYLVQLATVMEVDLLEVAQRKMAVNARKYPAAPRPP